jgi:hypothetical protein
MIKARTLPAAAALLLLLAAAGLAQKSAPTARDYFPLRVGDSWTYRNDEDESEFTVRVLSDERRAGGDVAYEVEKLAGVRIHSWYAKTPGWVLVLSEVNPEQEGIGVKHEPPRQLLKNPLVAGAKWTWKGKGMTGDDVLEINTVAGTDVVTTPAGRFRAMKVVSKVTDGDAAVTKATWYAPGVGLVKTLTETPTLRYGSQLVDYSFKKKSPRR